MRTIFMTILLVGWVSATATASPVARTHVGSVQVELSVNKAVYNVGESVEIRLVATNRGAQPATFQFSTGQMYDFIAMANGQRFWQWSQGRAFTQALTALTLQPGEATVFHERWDQRDGQDRQVPGGKYELVAVFPARESSIRSVTSLEGPRVCFTIAAGSRTSRSPQLPSVTSRTRIIGGSTASELLINGRPVLRIRVGAGGFSAARRAEILVARLQRLLAQGLKSAELTVVPVGREAAVMWRDQLVVTADAAHARLSGKHPTTLAMEWRESLVQALSPTP